MVAIRHSHELNPATFELAGWSESLHMSPVTFDKLQNAWRYSQEKLDPTQYELMWDGIEMAEILYGLNMDDDSLVAAMLFPLVKGNIIDLVQVKEDFSNQVKNLVKGVLEMENIRQLSSNSASDLQIDNIRRMLLAMVDDFRCVVIKLAERITYLRTKNRYSEEDIVLAAKECSHVYAPLANRLGIGQLKWELEDYCFRALHPQCYRQIAKFDLGERRVDREKYIANFVADLTASLKEELDEVQVYGRPKHIYSIWKKMQKKNLRFDQLFDIRAVRVIVQKLEDCYTALSIIHTQYKHLPEHFDDYIAQPKPNGYQSIHTVVLGKGDKPIEVQIRTQKMHDDAELGVAAHWKYKEGATAGRSGYEEKIVWLRKLLAWQNDIADSGDVLDEMRSQVFDDRVYVFTPRGEVIDLPKDATPLDFAYAIHSEIGHRCIGAKVAGKIVPFTYNLKMGDQVEIITQKQPNPSRDWLNPNTGFVNTSKARSKIIAWFKKLDREKNIPIGREALEAEIIKLGLTHKQIETYALPRYNLKQMDDLYAGIGGGDIKLNQLSHYLQSRLIKPTAEQEDEAVLKQLNKNSHQKAQNGQVIIEGVGNLMHSIARCCQPIPGDPIVGYITQGRGISIHKADCEQLFELQSLNPTRVVEAQWGSYAGEGLSLTIRIIANDRNGLLRDVSAIMANEKVNVLSVASRIDAKRSLAIINMEIQMNNVAMLNKILARITLLDDVIEARRAG
ncbi:GTP diphosphokinase [Haemophilus parahaemolyticus]|uniref:GTP pyrophosphokinase n=2 Tax=Haemophilus parahaemolyticus TaxID=735 RepID=A0AAE6JR29_HAEPH|nr:GTP diphosphokinase [Haemophilus parahaemolyticus]EIJ69616.1 RelA/SpoT family protein [Haemophilus parahaemolyticus HK385]OOR96935.1 GTP pyrophosphokinase [Haemophilus parahaemolyticus]QEN10422.1 GTP diphosphokinase [Haemophilus parahaemolyticus]QRP13410.1 GTP diphosphokinase [Haemophilus parahaemolyticus]STO65712.1 GTP pyrophosphokinase [Haemophilus parahaemolyticus HK385]